MHRLKKYNPLFPEVYESDSFDVPNVIIIVDDAERKGIDVCEGAIGWLDNKSGMEILYLYDTHIEYSGLKFVPAAICNTAYCVHCFDKNTFVKADAVLDLERKEKIAELEQIAYSLGAKGCRILIEEKNAESARSKKKSDTKVSMGKDALGSESVESEKNIASSAFSSSKGYTHFDGNNEVSVPELKWFANDPSISNLVKMRTERLNPVQSKDLTFSSVSVSSMSQKMAGAIDSAVKKLGGVKVKGSASIEQQFSKETVKQFEFHIDF